MTDYYENKLICYSDRYYLFGKGPSLLIADSVDGVQRQIGVLPVGLLKRLLGSFRIMARILRLEARCGIFVDDKIALVSFHGAIYRVDCENGNIVLEHQFRAEMNNPLCFTKIEDVEGVSDGIYYGEYFLNEQRKAVNIFKRDATGGWNVAYTFPEGSIYHIHGIIPCTTRKSVFVLTGDKDEESGIYEFKDDFTKSEIMACGKQRYRSCIALPVKDGIYYVTDTPLENNYLYYLDFTTKELKEVIAISGPCIYGKVLSENEMIFSTSVEPDSNIDGIRYEFTRLLGPGVKDRCSHLYYIKVGVGGVQTKEILTAKKDILPMGLAQFGTMMFPNGNGKALVTGQAICKWDNKTLMISDML